MEESGGMEQGKLASLGEEKITRDTRDSEKVEGQSLEILNDPCYVKVTSFGSLAEQQRGVNITFSEKAGSPGQGWPGGNQASQQVGRLGNNNTSS